MDNRIKIICSLKHDVPREGRIANGLCRACKNEYHNPRWRAIEIINDEIQDASNRQQSPVFDKKAWNIFFDSFENLKSYKNGQKRQELLDTAKLKMIELLNKKYSTSMAFDTMAKRIKQCTSIGGLRVEVYYWNESYYDKLK
ncbi:MAG: hypothetical protein ACREBR_04960 [bacterium]